MLGLAYGTEQPPSLTCLPLIPKNAETTLFEFFADVQETMSLGVRLPVLKLALRKNSEEKARSAQPDANPMNHSNLTMQESAYLLIRHQAPHPTKRG